MANEPIRIDGLKQFVKALKQLDTDLPKALRVGMNSAVNLVVDVAKPKVPSGPAKGGHAADSIKASSTQSSARVSAGGKKYPYYPWLDFGGRVGPRKSVQRPFLKSGRYIWRAYADNNDKVQELLGEALADVAHSAGLDIS